MLRLEVHAYRVLRIAKQSLKLPPLLNLKQISCAPCTAFCVSAETEPVRLYCPGLMLGRSSAVASHAAQLIANRPLPQPSNSFAVLRSTPSILFRSRVIGRSLHGTISPSAGPISLAKAESDSEMDPLGTACSA